MYQAVDHCTREEYCWKKYYHSDERSCLVLFALMLMKILYRRSFASGFDTSEQTVIAGIFRSKELLHQYERKEEI